MGHRSTGIEYVNSCFLVTKSYILFHFRPFSRRQQLHISSPCCPRPDSGHRMDQQTLTSSSCSDQPCNEIICNNWIIEKVNYFFLPLIHPTPVLGEGVELVVCDQVRLEILFPVSDTLHPVVRLGVDVDGSAEMVHRPAVSLVDGDLLLVGVTNGEST